MAKVTKTDPCHHQEEVEVVVLQAAEVQCLVCLSMVAISRCLGCISNTKDMVDLLCIISIKCRWAIWVCMDMVGIQDGSVKDIHRTCKGKSFSYEGWFIQYNKEVKRLQSEVSGDRKFVYHKNLLLSVYTYDSVILLNK